jgi:hypothetical protein
MLDHTIKEIEKTEKYFQRNNYPLIETEVAGRRLLFYQLPQSLNPDLPDYILRVTNDETKLYVMGVCDSIPEEIQPYFVLAEYIEFIEMGLQKKGKVVDAEKELLRTIPENLKESYVGRKIALYKKELELDLQEPEKYLLLEEGRKEFKDAICFLKDQLTLNT